MENNDKAILSAISKDFPLEEQPFAVLAGRLGLSEDEVLERVRSLKAGGAIRRLGATLNPRQLGWHSTLCAAEVPEERIDEYARVVNAYAAVTHNYVRAGHPNCWFTIIAPDAAQAARIIAEISTALGCEVREYPAGRVFKIGVSFTLE